MKAIKNTLFLSFLMGCIPCSFANMRAPMSLPQPPSSILKAPSAQEPESTATMPQIMVLNEQLAIECDDVECDVQATYQLQSATQSPLLVFEFVLPADVAISADINQQTIPVEFAVSEPLEGKPDEQHSYWRDPDFAAFTVHKAIFKGALKAGNNTIHVRYTQPLSIFESDYGYFQSSRYVERFLYILSPLREWDLAADFKMNIEVSTLKKRPQRNGGLFKKRSMYCDLPNVKETVKDGKIIHQYTIGKDFPDQLICIMGDKDLLPAQP